MTHAANPSADPFQNLWQNMPWSKPEWFQQGAQNFLSTLQPFLDQTAQAELVKAHQALWQSMMSPEKTPSEPMLKPAQGDRRFSHPEWHNSTVHAYLLQAYLLNADFLTKAAERIPDTDPKAKQKLGFAVRQIIDALAPSNFAATNPEFIQAALETEGASIRRGIENLIQDMEKGRISMTDESQFELGRNLATTVGAVVFENDLIQVIQYSPLTPKVAKRPLVIIPPCINKFYIMDLQPENSLIRYMVEQGNTVFLASWKNPGTEQAQLGWDDYLERGPIAAIEVALQISRQPQVNALGFCIGGTLLSSALGVLEARGKSPAASLTLLTTLLDFQETGEIGLFIDEATLKARETAIGKGGLLRGKELQSTFSALRPNDLIWNYVVNNYLKGQTPQAFDLLYWNSDSTHLPGPFACWYMRNLYLENRLRKANDLPMCGTTIDLKKLKMPTYLLATREDHIVPWESAYESTRILGGPIRFVLGASGHIAGVINPANKNKRSYWTHSTVAVSPSEWLNSATENKGSWWPDWANWLQAFSGGEKAAPRSLGNARYPVIEPAPGRYVKEKAV